MFQMFGSRIAVRFVAAVAVSIPILLAGASGEDLGSDFEEVRQPLRYDGLRILEEWLSQPQDYDLEVFVGSGIFDRILAGLEGVSVPIEELPGLAVQLDSLQAEFEDGAPFLRANAKVKHQAVPDQIGLSLLAILQVTMDENVAKARIRILDVAADESGPTSRFVLSIVKSYLEKLNVSIPEYSTPFARQFELTSEGSVHRTTFPIGQARVQSDIVIPPLSHQVHLSLTQAVFLKEGAHLFLAIQ